MHSEEPLDSPVPDTASGAELRRRIRDEVPADTFARQPAQAFLFVPLVGTIAAATALIAAYEVPWPAAFLLSFGIGGAYGSTYLLAHEVMHGAIVASPRLRHALGFIGLAPFVISPELWLHWHNRAHHGRANHDDLDPDVFATEERYRSHASARWIVKLAPGTESPCGFLALFYWLTLHGQLVLWNLSKSMPGFEHLRRRRAIVETLFLASFWGTLAVLLGFQKSFFAILLPMAVANFVAMSYIVTNHLIRHRSTHDQPLSTTMSVRTSPLFDRLHFHFGHHVEHHLFPSMSGVHAPRVRQWLEENTGKAYVCPTHGRALLAVLRTPRTYSAPDTLRQPTDTNGQRINVTALAEEMVQGDRG